MLRAQRTVALPCPVRPSLRLAPSRCSVPLGTALSFAPSRGFRTSPIVLAKAEGKKDAGGKGGAKGGEKKEGKVAKTGQKKEDEPSSTTPGMKKPKKTKEQIAAERKERKQKARERKKKLSMKKRNFWDITSRYKDFGAGKTLRRSIWPPEYQTFWTVSRVNMKKTLPPRGKAWGVFTWRGKTQKKERQIRGLLKREWTMYEPVSDAPPLVEQKPSAAHIEEVRPIMHAVYTTAATKHPVPRSRYGPVKVNTSWHSLTDEERKPIPGLPIKTQHGWNVPPEPPAPQEKLFGGAAEATEKRLRAQLEAFAKRQQQQQQQQQKNAANGGDKV